MGETAMSRIRRLRGVTWRWRDAVPDDVARTPTVGVVAQEVESVFPELVGTDRRGFKTVDYPRLVGPLIEAVKELDERLGVVEARLAASPPGEKEASSDPPSPPRPD
ncbi:MAG TPA: tail fiber domain-containing protein [Gaiellaceae bacterium]|nr:tail fiber domain-containing protein [Gaiellaceae bacterium]